MTERLFTCVTPLCANSEVGVQDALAAEELPLKESLRALPMLHFASLTLFPPKDGVTPATLLFECNIDGCPTAFVKALVKAARPSLDAIYGGIDGYPPRGVEDKVVAQFLQKHVKRATLYHVGHPRRRVQAIAGDLEFRRSLERQLRNDASLTGLSPVEQMAKLRKRANCPPWWAQSAYPWPTAWDAPGTPPDADGTTPLDKFVWRREGFAWKRIWHWLVLVLVGLMLEVSLSIVLARAFGTPPSASLVLSTLAIFAIVHASASDIPGLHAVFAGAVIAVPASWILRCLHVTDVTAVPDCVFYPSLGPVVVLGLLAGSFLHIAFSLKVAAPSAPLNGEIRSHLHDLMEVEDLSTIHSIYNHVTGYSVLKPDQRLWRRVRTLLVLMVLNLFYRTYFSKGKLSSIPTIHFAQWSLVNDHVLFMTNYDGSADSYLDDFFNVLAQGVAFIWFDTVAFQRTSDASRLKRWVRDNQKLAAIRYRAPVYEGLTVEMINTNTWIRKGLITSRHASAARRWMRRFGSSHVVEPSLLWRILAAVTDVVRGGSEGR